METKFNHQKLKEDLRFKRLITEGITLIEAASEIGVPPGMITKVEKFESKNLTVDGLIKITEWLGNHPGEYF